MSKDRQPDDGSVKSAPVASSAGAAREFDPMADDEASTAESSAVYESVPIGIPLADASYARMKKDAETSQQPRNRAQEDGHGCEEDVGEKKQ